MSDEHERIKIRYYLGGIRENGEKWLYSYKKSKDRKSHCVYVTDSNGKQYDDFELAAEFEYDIPDMPVIVDVDSRIVLDIDDPTLPIAIQAMICYSNCINKHVASWLLALNVRRQTATAITKSLLGR